ncbi:hypothetical protein B0H14DRAFT_3480875 [Mycena olivaceomarginata]|nr:hypothetical protein B0H14DRAFT_3480875 [Mycena olivaceomarginata]
MHRPAAEPVPWRAAQRRQCLFELEDEERHLSLFFSFRSVEFEWSGLDGMRSVRRRYNLTHAFLRSPPAPPRLISTRTQRSSTPARGTQSARPRSRSPLPPHANVHHSYSHPPPPPAAPEHSPSPLTRTSRPSGRITLSQCAGRHTSPSYAPTHSVTFAPVRVHTHTRPDADVHEHPHFAHTARDAAHGAERVVPVCPCAYVAGAWRERETQVWCKGEELQSREGAVSVLPLLRLHCIDAVSHTRATATARFRGWAGVGGGEEDGEGEDDDGEDGEMTVVADDRERERDEELPTPVPCRSELRAQRRRPRRRAARVRAGSGADAVYDEGRGEGAGAGGGGKRKR